MTALPAWLSDERLVMVAWSRLAEPGDRAAAAARETLGAATALGHLVQGRPLPLEVAQLSAPERGVGTSRRLLDEATERWRVRMEDLDPGRDLEAMQRLGMPLLVHGEVTDAHGAGR